jgi:cobalamin biosynthesis protein CbiG
MSASCGNVLLGPRVRELAAALAALFAADQQLAVELNAAQRRLLDATDLLRVGVSRDALRTLLDPSGLDVGLAMGVQAAASAGLEAIADTIREALRDYQLLADQRREVAADIGEATVRLVEAMAACGFGEAQARNADVRALRDGVYCEGG